MTTRNEQDAIARRAAIADASAQELSVREAVARSPFKRSTIYAAIRTGELPAHKVRGRRVIMIEDLRRWVAGERQASA